ncbi:MAG TPA: hypothetical protein VJT73_07230 [Polyangiaceae bacterium]|nr:hypothetical protein [Polyangiaceae bacterium]
MKEHLDVAPVRDRSRNPIMSLAASVSILLTAFSARAQEPAPAAQPYPTPSADPAAIPVSSDASALPPAPETPKPKPPPYSLPWQLRPAAAATVIRSDTAFGFRKPAAGSGTTVAETLLFSYKVTPEFAPMVRVGVVSDKPPVGDSGFAFLNPVVGGTYVIKLSPSVRLALFLGLTVPVGSGGGNTPDKTVAPARTAGVFTRSAFDNAMFAVNYMTVFPGVDLAYVAGGLTVQAEATIFELFRVKGDLVDRDSTRTNFTTGLHIGYFVAPIFSLGADLRYQAWVSNPMIPDGSPLRDTVTVAVGPRFHFKLSDKAWFRPGIAYARGIDDPMADQKYNVVQLDLPFSF